MSNFISPSLIGPFDLLEFYFWIDMFCEVLFGSLRIPLGLFAPFKAESVFELYSGSSTSSFESSSSSFTTYFVLLAPDNSKSWVLFFFPSLLGSTGSGTPFGFPG